MKNAHCCVNFVASSSPYSSVRLLRKLLVSLHCIIFHSFLALSLFGTAWAAPLGSREVKLSTPIGGDVLPGGGFTAPDIESSFVFSKLIPFAIKYGLGLAVALAVVALIIGGFQFMTSYGETEKRQAAQKTIQYAVIGLIVAITAYGIVTIISNFSYAPPAE